ncbi:MAG: hypothetical protein DF168_00885 [Candidatus Moanabacter tarae]|uniref:LysM domain-containing protein n=1 Tax=Candidatus Moanibacter tarae TaxID=2200854 RepID=A0A2Z4ACP7_9BACT|nr:MAG: hypothetical protein DF168_00885 [Candidatus Moanabacter tarae]|tara:strand:+ start:647 stop:1300 length:654 start_codon:yes stop_codon:yes gene_type:complete
MWEIFSGYRSTILVILMLNIVSAEGARNSPYSNTMEVPRIEWANLKQDMEVLRQEVGKLRIESEGLRRENSNLEGRINEIEKSKELLSENYVSFNRLNERLEKFQRNLQKQTDEVGLEQISEVRSQIVKLASQTEEALNLLAQSIDNKSYFKTEFKFSDKYPKQGLAYTVQAGDTLSQIAKQFDATVQDIQNANKILDPTRLMAGETIFIPQKEKKF